MDDKVDITAIGKDIQHKDKKSCEKACFRGKWKNLKKPKMA